LPIASASARAGTRRKTLLARFAGQPYRTPDHWFAEARRVGLGVELELYAVTLASQQLPELPDQAYLSVNLSPQTILDDRLGRLLMDVDAGVRRVVVEVTEHAAVDDYDALSDAVQWLRRLGVRLAIDDAGAGYASMQHVLRLRPDIIKLDRAIVAGIDGDLARRALVTAMVSFASSLDMTVVGEGGETAGELAVLADTGVQNAQGFFLARPADLAALREAAIAPG
jgi:EAL domain-containing protein (putative c-di-GMP-specific phosphodiesterase class I)